MVEEPGTILVQGFDTWKRNINITLPFILSSALTIAIAVIIAGVPYWSHPGDGLTQGLAHHKIGPIALFTIIIVLGLIINAYFLPGAIGMVKEAIRRGSTNISDMLKYGKRNFIPVLFMEFIFAAITIPGVALIGGIAMLLKLSATAYLLVSMLYVLAMGIIFALVPYAIVIDDYDTISGLKSGLKLFSGHKLDVFLLWLIIIAIGAVTGFVPGIIPRVGPLLSLVVSAVLVQPIAVACWSILYMNITHRLL